MIKVFKCSLQEAKVFLRRHAFWSLPHPVHWGFGRQFFIMLFCREVVKQLLKQFQTLRPNSAVNGNHVYLGKHNMRVLWTRVFSIPTTSSLPDTLRWVWVGELANLKIFVLFNLLTCLLWTAPRSHKGPRRFRRRTWNFSGIHNTQNWVCLIWINCVWYLISRV